MMAVFLNRRPQVLMTSKTHPSRFRRKDVAILGLAALAAAVVVASYEFRSHGTEFTDDAYVQGNIVQVTSQVSGTVIAINADDTQSVSAGAIVARLNPVDFQLQLERSNAALASATRQARIQFHQVSQLQAELMQRQTDLDKATQDLKRREMLAPSGAVSGEEIQHSADVVANARDALEVSRQQLAQKQAMIDNLTLSSHPEVLAAASKVKDAYIALHRAEIPSPVDGVVSKRGAQLGQHVAAGTVLMSVVPMEQVWVDANFKESQLEHIRVGQRVTLTTDIYGDKVVYHGAVVGLDAGTGSAFALLPAQNATGNWIKVTQRLPVRIKLEEDELRRSPLRLGFSMHVSVDTNNHHGKKVGAVQAYLRESYDTHVFDDEMRNAESLVQSIISANAGLPDGGRNSASGGR